MDTCQRQWQCRIHTLDPCRRSQMKKRREKGERGGGRVAVAQVCGQTRSTVQDIEMKQEQVERKIMTGY